MSAQVFLFGTNHPLQCGVNHSESQIETFRSYIIAVCKNEEVSFIAEEMNQQGLDRHKVESTVAANLARELDIPHCYVDLEEDERAKLLISDGALAMIAMKLSRTENAGGIREDLNLRVSYPIRERYWVARILSTNVWPTLFICGSNHVCNVASILGGIIDQSTIVEYDFAPRSEKQP